VVDSFLTLELTLAHLERAINHALVFSLEWPDYSPRLEGVTLRCELSPLDLQIYVLIKNAQISLSTQGPESVDLTIKATLSALLEMAQTKRAGSHISISGNAHLAQTLQQIISSLTIDWEGLLAEHLGDLVARQVSGAFEKFKNFTQRLISTTFADTADYLVDEKQLLPSKTEADQFYQDVTTLRYAADRLGARIRLLEGN
jgi:ubiquinone biosynthesis protein UbiJ